MYWSGVKWRKLGILTDWKDIFAIGKGKSETDGGREREREREAATE